MNIPSNLGFPREAQWFNALEACKASDMVATRGLDLASCQITTIQARGWSNAGEKSAMKCVEKTPLYHIWLVVWNIFYFSIYWEKSFQLTHIFQRGWNHQSVYLYIYIKYHRVYYIPYIYIYLLHMKTNIYRWAVAARYPCWLMINYSVFYYPMYIYIYTYI